MKFLAKVKEYFLSNNKKLIPYIIVLTILLLSVGYSAFSSNLSVRDLYAQVRLQKDIRVTGVSVTAETMGSPTYLDYNVSNIQAGIILPSADSSLTFNVELTNIGSAEVGITEITGLPDNLDYEILNYNLKDKICDTNNVCKLGIQKEIQLKIKYKDGGYDSSNTQYNIVANFNFQSFYTVTYTDIEGQGYPTEILGGDTLIVDFGDNAPNKIKVKMQENETSNYTYENGMLIINNVNGNIEIIKVISLIQHITNLYNSSTLTDSLLINGITYKLDTTNYLMNDRLGSSGVEADAGNIRYYGANPNNYIDIGDRDSEGNIIFWRIIGLFKDVEVTDENENVIKTEDLVKIIRSENLTAGDVKNFSWDYTSEGAYDNNWLDSTLQLMLNDEVNGYYNSGTPIYYNNSITPTFLNFTSTGLSSNVHSKVARVNWNFDGHKSSSVYVDEIYKYERVGTNIWSGKIALMYPSDYGYASDLSSCQAKLGSYNTGTCKTTNWLYNSTSTQWTLTTYSSAATRVFYINSSGYLYSTTGHTNYMYSVRPVLYLNADVGIVKKDTTSDGVSYYVVE